MTIRDYLKAIRPFALFVFLAIGVLALTLYKGNTHRIDALEREMASNTKALDEMPLQTPTTREAVTVIDEPPPPWTPPKGHPARLLPEQLWADFAAEGSERAALLFYLDCYDVFDADGRLTATAALAQVFQWLQDTYDDPYHILRLASDFELASQTRYLKIKYTPGLTEADFEDDLPAFWALSDALRNPK